MTEQERIEVALKLLERTKAQQKKQLDRNKYRKEICDLVEMKALEFGKSGEVVVRDWLKAVLKSAKG